MPGTFRMFPAQQAAFLDLRCEMPRRSRRRWAGTRGGSRRVRRGLEHASPAGFRSSPARRGGGGVGTRDLRKSLCKRRDRPGPRVPGWVDLPRLTCPPCPAHGGESPALGQGTDVERSVFGRRPVLSLCVFLWALRYRCSTWSLVIVQDADKEGGGAVTAQR